MKAFYDGRLIGYRCPGCDFGYGTNHADAYDLITHTLAVVVGRNRAAWKLEVCHDRVHIRSAAAAGWHGICLAYDEHLPHCNKYKLHCLAGTHPPPHSKGEEDATSD